MSAINDFQNTAQKERDTLQSELNATMYNSQEQMRKIASDFEYRKNMALAELAENIAQVKRERATRMRAYFEQAPDKVELLCYLQSKIDAYEETELLTKRKNDFIS